MILFVEAAIKSFAHFEDAQNRIRAAKTANQFKAEFVKIAAI